MKERLPAICKCRETTLTPDEQYREGKPGVYHARYYCDDMDIGNPFEGIFEAVNNTWAPATAPTQPLTADWLAKGLERMEEAENEKRDYQMIVVAKYREAMKDPDYAARQEALFQAAIDLQYPAPDVLNPPIVSKAMYDKMQARADEILAQKNS